MLTSRIYIKSNIYGMWHSFKYFVLLSLLVNIKISGGSIYLFHASIDSPALFLSPYFVFLVLKQNKTSETFLLVWRKIYHRYNSHPGEILRYSDNKLGRYFMYIKPHKNANTFYTSVDIHIWYILSIFKHMWEIQ